MEHKQIEIDHLLSREEVAKIYGVSIPTVDRWAREGTLPPAFKIGKTTRWRTSDIKKHIAGEARHTHGSLKRVRPVYAGAK